MKEAVSSSPPPTHLPGSAQIIRESSADFLQTGGKRERKIAQRLEAHHRQHHVRDSEKSFSGDLALFLRRDVSHISRWQRAADKEEGKPAFGYTDILKKNRVS